MIVAGNYSKLDISLSSLYLLHVYTLGITINVLAVYCSAGIVLVAVEEVVKEQHVL